MFFFLIRSSHSLSKMNACSEVHVRPSVRLHASSPKLLNGFRLHLILDNHRNVSYRPVRLPSLLEVQISLYRFSQKHLI